MSHNKSGSRYDRAYFDRWYRDPKTRVKSSAAIRRKAALSLSVAEYYLERPVRTVLDVGCGEGNWLPALRSLRKGIRYTGVDASSYAVGRYGKSRNIRLGTFDTLEEIGLADDYDLIVCSDTSSIFPFMNSRRALPLWLDGPRESHFSNSTRGRTR